MSGYIIKREVVPAVLSRMFCGDCDVEMVAIGDRYPDGQRHQCPQCGYVETTDVEHPGYPSLRQADQETDQGLMFKDGETPDGNTGWLAPNIVRVVEIDLSGFLGQQDEGQIDNA